MKKQRILALTLAAATATTMFGSFSASAINVGGYDGAFVALTSEDLDNTSVADVSKIWTGTVAEALDAYSVTEVKGLTFLDNFVGQKDEGSSYKYADVEAAINEAKDAGYTTLSDMETAAESEDGDPVAKAAIKAMNQYFANTTDDEALDSSTFSGDAFAALDGATQATLTSTRGQIVSDFVDDRNAFKKLTMKYYEEDDLKGFNVYTTENANTLYKFMTDEADQVAETSLSKANVYYQYLSNSYNRFFVNTDSNTYLTPIKSDADVYAEKLAKVEALNEDDYTADNWRSIEKYLDEAIYQAERKENYAQAVIELNKALDVRGKAPKTTELKSALYGLFTEAGQGSSGALGTALTAIDNDIVANTNTEGGAILWDTLGTLAAGKYEGNNSDDANYFIYLEDDYEEAGWVDFAGNGTNVNSSNFVLGAYRKALYTYEAATSYPSKYYISQTTVDEAVAELETAILALDPTYDSSNWATVKMQEALDKAEAVVETDYRTTANVWKEFIKAKEYVEKLLASGSVKDTIASQAADDLLTAIENLSSAKIAVPASTKTDLNASLKEAEKLLKDKEGKTAAQIIALEEAIKDAKKIDSSKTISQYEAAQKALDAAIAGYKHPQGWYQKDGKWFYGKDDKDLTGWIVDNGKDYYLNADGSMATGWVKSERGYWYWMDATKGGAMTKNAWVKVNNGYYFLQANGIMATGWINDNGTWYYANPSSGAIVYNGWYQINGKHYYFYANGAMAANTTINGYKVDASGAWVK